VERVVNHEVVVEAEVLRVIMGRRVAGQVRRELK
jgi:hypothetical protein